MEAMAVGIADLVKSPYEWNEVLEVVL